MQTVQTGYEKQIVYAYEYRRLQKALKEKFYLEAISIDYAIIEDRLVAFLHHAGIVSRKSDKLVINNAVSPFIHSLLDKQINESIRIKDISVKMNVIRRLLLLSDDKAKIIDNEIKETANTKRKQYLAQRGYLAVLQRQIANTVDIYEVLDILDRLDQWRDERNQLIHALLSKTVDSSTAAQKVCAEEGKDISRQIDEKLVKPFKKYNRIREQFNIQ